MSTNPNIKQLILVTLVIFAALTLVFSLILKNSFDFRGLSTSPMPGWRLSYDGETGEALVPDPALILPRPIGLAGVPRATRFDMPLGSEQAALTYDSQPFLTLNPKRGGKHLGDDLNGIGGMDTDRGDPVYAIGAGRIAYSADARAGWGNVIIIEHRLADGTKFQSFYGHLERRDLPVGSHVVRGEPIGTVGNGGGRYPAHLHLELRDSHCPDPGRGYFDAPLGRLDPSGTLKRYRGAADDLLNTAPREVLVEPKVEFE